MENRLTINEEKCKGCDLCISVCPKDILAKDVEKINLKGYNPVGVEDITKCTACAMCAIICPDSVIKVEKGV